MSKGSSVDPSARRAGDPGRRRRKKQRTRLQIHGAAMALFAERGFDAVTLDQICEAADVARGTFFLHFPSKGALLQELEQQLAEELAGTLAEARGSALVEYRTLVERFFGDWPRRQGLRPDLLAAMLREALAAPPSADRGPGLRERVEGVVRRGQQRGELRRGVSPGLAATLFLATAAALLAEGVPSGASDDESESDGDTNPARWRSQLLRVLLHGLAEGKPRLKWSAPGRDRSRETSAPPLPLPDRSR